MKRILPLLLLPALVMLSRAQIKPATDPALGRPAGMSVSIPAEMRGKGDISVEITLHYREGGTHHLMDNQFRFCLVDEKGDQIKQGLFPPEIPTELELEGADPVYTARLGIDTQNKPPLATGSRYQLVVMFQGFPGLVNVKSFTVVE